MATVAVVILNYNGRNYLEEFLPSVIEHSSDAEIIVADNASTDDSIAFLKKSYPDVRLIQIERNYGFAGGYNVALKEVKTEYYLLVNSDIELTPGWITPLISFLENNPAYAACQPKILDQNNKTFFEYAGGAGGFVDLFGYPFCRGRIFDTIEEDSGQYDNSIDIGWASGACFAIRSECFHLVGGFDEDFFAHMEEIDLCWRLQNLGLKIRNIPHAIVYHVGGGTLAKSSPFKTYLNFRNGLGILIKNLPTNQLIWKLPIRVFLDWLAASQFLFSSGYQHSLAIAKAHLHTLLKFNKTLAKRNDPHVSITGSFSVVKKYFFDRKRKYSDV